MGIDIGDLSSVLLCSVPPAQANYLQRIGRAGRSDGNAFTMTLATGRRHDLYFYEDPQEMMAGRVEPPGVFLDAAAVIERQLAAYCMDCWVAGGVDASAIPHTLKPVIDAVEKADLRHFPYNLIDFFKQNAPELLEGFLALFGAEISERTQGHLKQLLLGEDADQRDLENIIIHRLYELTQERKRLRSRIDNLKRHIDRLEKLPQDEATQAELHEAQQERSGLQGILRTINGRETLNFFTDEGLIPNYAFPEAGVTLRSVIYRRRAQPIDGDSAYENHVYEYERPGAAAIGELAPDNYFYAGGRRVKITQVDLGLSDIESWRFCPSCSHAENLSKAGDNHVRCPRCGNPMWADSGQRVQMARLRQVMANTSDRDSRIGDDSDDREPTFYTRQMLADFDPGAVELAYRIARDSLPFGFEFIRKTTFREVNFGEYSSDQRSIIAGNDASRPGFLLCRHCGSV
jgi:DEAD/DEAH box helicase domain-containing protein